jgi:hypothetical protein
MTEIRLKCRCDSFRALLHRAGKRHGNRCVCYCADCQAFAKYLGREDEILDRNGGTDIYQASPGRLEILRGIDRLVCVHLTEHPTLRWYTDCCKSPIGNTLNSNRLPFIGLIHSCIDVSNVEGGLDTLIGPVRARVNGSGARGDTRGLNIHRSAPLSLYLRFGRMVIASKLNGEYKRSPFFDRDTGKPIVLPLRQPQ